MKSLRVRVDGRGRSRIDPLPLPFVYTGPAAVESDRLPDGISSLTEGSVVAVRHAPGSVEHTASERRVELVVSGTVEVQTEGSRALLGAGDVLMLDDLAGAGGTLRFVDDCRTLRVSIAESWSPAGVVPPPVAPLTRDEPKISEMYVVDDLSYFREFGRLFESPDSGSSNSQPVEAVKFIVFSDGHDGDWHVDKTTNLVFVASGELELQVSGGSQPVERYAPGDVCLVQDLVGQGHILRARGETRIIAITVPDDHRWRIP